MMGTYATLSHGYFVTCVQILLSHREAVGTLNVAMEDGTTPLMTAVKLAVEEMVEQLLSCQVEVNAVDNKGSYCYLFFLLVFL